MELTGSRKTKIIATLGPATQSPEMLSKLIVAGVNIFRLNMSHGKHDWVRHLVKDIRAAAAVNQKHVGILMDTQGPAIRTGDLAMPISLKPGAKFTFTVRGERSEEEHSVDVNYAEFVNDISVNDTVLLDNGAIHMKVLVKNGNKVECEVLTAGTLGSRRHINLPGVKVSLPAITDKDRADILVGLEMGVDYIALSFVREAADIQELRAFIKANMTEARAVEPQVVAKIEDQSAVQNVEAIIREADGIMIARGDLGIEIPYEELPIVQRRIVKSCLRAGKPVIVATHMLESMIESPMPTRAEVTDVSNAVFEQADAIMLSGETTVGKYPLKCIEVFDRIARRIERSGGANYFEAAQLATARQKVVKSAVVMANELRAEAILVFTRHGHMARHTGWMRPRHSRIYALCAHDETAAGLSLYWGVIPVVVPFDMINPENTIEGAMKQLTEEGHLHKGNIVVVIGSILVGSQIVDAVQMRTVD